MGLYKYVTADTAKRILNGTIRLTQPRAFNDPFELLPQFITPLSIKGGEEQLSFCLVSPRRKGLDRRRSGNGASNHSDAQARRLSLSLNDAIGILCLSRNEESLLMWGHYADNYSGAVIEFDEKHPFFNGLNPVKYQKKRPIFNICDFLGKSFPISDLCVKSSEWSYEKEVRVIKDLSKCASIGKVDAAGNKIYTMDLPIECIKGVTMGERMPIDAQRELWRMVKNTNLRLSLAAVSNWDYEFRHEPIKFPGDSTSSPVMSPRTARIFVDEEGQLGDAARWLVDNHELSQFVALGC